MLIDITMKTPDAINVAMDESGIVDQDARSAMSKYLEQWFKYGEYITLRFNTKTGELLPLRRCPLAE